VNDYQSLVLGQVIVAAVGAALILAQRRAWKTRWLYWTLGVIGWPLFVVHAVGCACTIWLYGG
jgi:hypothetical protein